MAAPMVARPLSRSGPGPRAQPRFAGSRPTQAPKTLVRSITSENEGKHLSPDVSAIFNEAQRNIQELNRSRLKALEDLQQANLRIEELENLLADSRAKQQHAEELVAKAREKMGDSWGEVAAEVPAPEPSGITVLYETGWEKAFIHFNADGKGWTKAPGQQMEQGRGDRAHCKVFQLVGASAMEFATTNGADWDTPNPFGDVKANYVITEPGVYRLKSGSLRKME